MTRIFVSYSRQDKAVVYPFANRLRAQGHEVYDVTGIPGGATWQYEIEQAIVICDVVLAMWSQASKRSQWVDKEILFALELEKNIIPVLLEKARLSLALINLQPIDYTGNQEQGFAILLQAISKRDDKLPPRELEKSVPQDAVVNGISLVEFREAILLHQKANF